MKSLQKRAGFGVGLALGILSTVAYAPGVFADWVVDTQMEAVTVDAGGKMASLGFKRQARLKFRDKMARATMEQASTITNGETGEEIVLNESKKTYWIKSAQESQGVKKELVKPTATGKKDKVVNSDVEEYKAVAGERTYTFLMTKETPETQGAKDALMAMFARQCAQEGTPGVDISGLPGYPKRILIEFKAKTLTDKDGKKIEKPRAIFVTTVISIREEKVDTREFEVPAGYTQVKPVETEEETKK